MKKTNEDEKRNILGNILKTFFNKNQFCFLDDINVK